MAPVPGGAGAGVLRGGAPCRLDAWQMIRLAHAVLILALIAAAGELAVRGLYDIKLYGADGEVGFWSRPNQAGGAPLTGSYAFNSDGFGVSDRYVTSGDKDVLLVGDSVVAGTASIEQDQRLALALARRTGWRVWPLATGGWALPNEVRALGRIDLSGVEAIILVVNSLDFQAAAQWPGDDEMPRAQPVSHLYQAIRKLLPFLRGPREAIPVRQEDLSTEWARFRAAAKVPVYIVGYESKGTAGRNCDWLPAWIGPEALCVDLVEMGRGGDMLDAIHPDARGNEAIAALIAARFGRRETVAD